MTQEQANWEWIDARVKKLEEHCFSAKTLTDEEIRKVADEVFKNYKNWHHYQIDFARAILRKAQEK